MIREQIGWSHTLPKQKKMLLKRNFFKPTDENSSINIDDRMVRLIGIPFFGLVIPNATGLVQTRQLHVLPLIGHYIYFIFIAWIVWEGNKYLRDKYAHIMMATKSAVTKYLSTIAINIVYTLPVSLILLFGWKWVCGFNDITGIDIFITCSIIVVSVIFVSNIYDKVHLIKIEEKQNIKVEQLERAKIQAELEALKNQIDPHFMFNALNSLSYLIEHDPIKAQAFTENLGDVYRYILQSKDKELVLLQDEIAFMNMYNNLLELRYEDALEVTLNAPAELVTGTLLPPVSLMVAIENVVKHNEVSQGQRMAVKVDVAEQGIRITNRFQPKKTYRESTKTGLKNLDERFTKILGKGIHIEHDKDFFVLEMPILRLNPQ